MRIPASLTSFAGTLKYAILPIIIIASVVLSGAFLFVHGRSIMADELKDRLKTTAAIAALQIDPSLMTPLQTFADTKKPQYKTLVTELDQIRKTIPDVRFVYLMRPTKNPMMMSFVADADGLKTAAQLDVNHNGVVDPDEEPGHPGDPYDISGTPAMQNLTQPAVDTTFSHDQWGTFISGYAPVRDAKGKVVGLLGMDMDSQNFVSLSEQIFSPVALLLVAVAGLMMAAYVFLVVRERRMEALMQLNIDRTALIDLATHQLGAPLATFRWWVEILRGETKKKHDDALQQLEEGIARMDQIMTSMRSAVHMQGKQADYQEVCVSLKKIIALLPPSTMTMLKRRKQTLHIGTKPGLKICVDPKVFVGVLQELIENASYYSPEKKPIAVHALQKGRRVIIQVIDHGYGIPDKDLPHLFQQFARGSNAMHYKPVGNGLGLYIAKNIVEHAKGTITVESSADAGTTFTISLPAY